MKDKKSEEEMCSRRKCILQLQQNNTQRYTAALFLPFVCDCVAGVDAHIETHRLRFQAHIT